MRIYQKHFYCWKTQFQFMQEEKTLKRRQNLIKEHIASIRLTTASPKSVIMSKVRSVTSNKSTVISCTERSSIPNVSSPATECKPKENVTASSRKPVGSRSKQDKKFIESKKISASKPLLTHEAMEARERERQRRKQESQRRAEEREHQQRMEEAHRRRLEVEQEKLEREKQRLALMEQRARERVLEEERARRKEQLQRDMETARKHYHQRTLLYFRSWSGWRKAAHMALSRSHIAYETHQRFTMRLGFFLLLRTLCKRQGERENIATQHDALKLLRNMMNFWLVVSLILWSWCSSSAPSMSRTAFQPVNVIFPLQSKAATFA
jgi:hypothetical protein